MKKDLKKFAITEKQENLLNLHIENIKNFNNDTQIQIIKKNTKFNCCTFCFVRPTTKIILQNQTDQSKLNLINQQNNKTNKYKINLMKKQEKQEIEISKINSFHINEDIYGKITKNDYILKDINFNNQPNYYNNLSRVNSDLDSLSNEFVLINDENSKHQNTINSQLSKTNSNLNDLNQEFSTTSKISISLE